MKSRQLALLGHFASASEGDNHSSSPRKVRDPRDGSIAMSEEQLNARMNGDKHVGGISTGEYNHSGPCNDFVPRKDDSLMVLSEKMTTLANVVKMGDSVARMTEYALAANCNNNDPDAVRKAVTQMPPLEYMTWEAWEAGHVTLPEINWMADIEPSPTSPQGLRVARRRAEALNRLYGTDQARSGHSVWFTKHHLPLLPLVKAAARVIGAERHLVGGRQNRCSVEQWADLQSINRILSISSQIVATDSSSSLLVKRVGAAQEVLVRERSNLRALVGH